MFEPHQKPWFEPGCMCKWHHARAGDNSGNEVPTSHAGPGMWSYQFCLDIVLFQPAAADIVFSAICSFASLFRFVHLFVYICISMLSSTPTSYIWLTNVKASAQLLVPRVVPGHADVCVETYSHSGHPLRCCFPRLKGRSMTECRETIEDNETQNGAECTQATGVLTHSGGWSLFSSVHS